MNKFSGRCNNINDPYAKLCVPGIIKNINVRVFGANAKTLMQRINETASLCNSRQIWNKDKCRCKFREDLVDKGICNK